MSSLFLNAMDIANRTVSNAEKLRSFAGLIGFFVLIGVLNGHLLGINDIRSFLFLPHAVGSGQWWRLLTFPFVHVSWYHLVLDVGAFVYLYSSIQQNTFDRLVHVIISGSFSLAAAFILSPAINDMGLCGLSGIDHGLLTVTSLVMIMNKENRLIGCMCLALVLLKSTYEMIAGDVFFSSVHLGLCGKPLVACHMGGVLGGMVSYCIYRLLTRQIN
jgi:rhomboid family GlyGly-CTERM serine protease